jgi:peptidoglycan/LPS O-acetylase OafA/YrhL
MLHFITSVPRYRMQALIVMIPSLIVAQMSMMREAGIRHINGDDFILYWPEAVGATLFMVIVIGAFVYVPMPKRADKALQLGGMMTYPLYLLHMFVGWVIIAKCAAHGMRIDLAILTAMIVIVPVAVAISAWGEPFVGKYLKAALKSSTNAIEPHLPKALWKLLYTPQAKRRMAQPTAASTADAQPALPT